MKKAFLPVLVFAKISIRRVFRDKTALFFTFLFPLIFLFVFGNIFGKNSSVTFHVAVINQSSTDFSKQFTRELSNNKAFKINTKSTTLDDAKQSMGRGQLDATIVLPPQFGTPGADKYPTGQAMVYYTQNSQEAAQTLVSVLNAIFGQVNQQYVKAAVPFSVKSEQLNTKSLSQFDYTFAGLLGFSIIGIGIFGPINYFPELKKQGVLRRLHTTPLRVWQYFVSTVISNAIVGLMTIVVMFAVAIAVFHLKLVGNVFELAAFLVLSISMILGIGLALGGWARNERQAAPLSNIVVFPMMFLSGTFFPRFLMPEWLQQVSAFLPLTPVIDGIRVIATEGEHLTQILPQIGMVSGWLVVIYLVAFRVFRWE
jgi:ABC-2 type transport system permease protein